ncbi:quinone-dependent dihydroorotate dehydrogenase [soil metagenome]
MIYRLLRPLLFRLDPERAHGIGMAAARLAAAASPVLRSSPDPALSQTLWNGLVFESPVGLAPGFDKNGTRLKAWEALGFGFVEIGSATARPSAGNPRPRAFRLPADRALINRMGLNNDGADVIAGRLESASPKGRFPIGVNVAKTHDPAILGDAALNDFAYSVERLMPVADFVVLNISCPNTAEGKTFEEPTALDALLQRVATVRMSAGTTTPVLVKLAPPDAEGIDKPAVRELLAICRTHEINGFVISNTASDRGGLQSDAQTLEAIGNGGLSGQPLRERALALTRFVYGETGGALPIIGVGGIDSPEAAYERIRAGASLLEIYTALVYEGPGLVRRIHRELPRLLERDGFSSLAAAVGSEA